MNAKFLPFSINYIQRASLLESLSQVQASPDEVSQMTAISAMQTLGLRKLTELDSEIRTQPEVVQKEVEVKKYSSIAGEIFVPI